MPQTGTADVDLCPHQLIFFSITLSAGSLLIQQVLLPWHPMSGWMFLHIWWKLDSVFLPNLVSSGAWWSLWIIDRDGKVTNAQLCCRAWAFFLSLIITLSPLCLLVIMSTEISCCLHHKREAVPCSAAAARILFPVVVCPGSADFSTANSRKHFTYQKTIFCGNLGCYWCKIKHKLLCSKYFEDNE